MDPVSNITQISGSDFNNYADYITAISTLVLAVLTGFLLVENRGLRKAGSAAQLAAFIAPAPDGHGAVEFVIANIGKGPAFDVAFKLIYDEADFEAHKVMIANDQNRTPITVIPQDEKQKFFFGIGFQLYGKVNGADIAPMKPFRVDFSYRDAVGRKKRRSYTIDIRQFAGLPGLITDSSDQKIVKALESINLNLTAMSGRGKQPAPLIKFGKIGDVLINKEKGSDDIG